MVSKKMLSADAFNPYNTELTAREYLENGAKFSIEDMRCLIASRILSWNGSKHPEDPRCLILVEDGKDFLVQSQYGGSTFRIKVEKLTARPPLEEPEEGY